MEIWETDAAILGSGGEIELQEAGWEPFCAVYIPISNDDHSESYIEVVYRRKKEGLKEAE